MARNVVPSPPYFMDSDSRLRSVTPLPPPAHLSRLARPSTGRSIADHRSDIRNIVQGHDDRLLMFVGPGLLQRGGAIVEYATRLKKLADSLADDLLVVLHASPVIPVPDIWWSGPIFPEGNTGDVQDFALDLGEVREVLTDLCDIGLAVGHEVSDIRSIDYLSSLMSWAVLPPSLVASQPHIELISSLPYPIGIAASQFEGIEAAMETIHLCRRPAHFLSTAMSGQVCIKESTGNRDSIPILMGQRSSSLNTEDFNQFSVSLTGAGLLDQFLVSLDNDFPPTKNLCAQIESGARRVRGAILSSFLVAGRAEVTPGSREPRPYGQSVDRVCQDWATTEEALTQIAMSVRRQRGASFSTPSEENGFSVADKHEEDAYRYLSAGDPALARKSLELAVGEDSTRSERLRRELGFLLDGASASDSAERVTLRDWLRGLWRISAASSVHEVAISNNQRQSKEKRSESEPLAPAELVQSLPVHSQTGLNSEALSPAELGAKLEIGVLRVLRRLFVIAEDVESALLQRIRRQRPGLQMGHDLEFDCQVQDERRVACHVECKNYLSPITTRDIADKLLQQEMYWRHGGIDHWILISPHTDPSNELSLLLDYWAASDRFPFSVQVWSPESGVHALFALDPELCEELYGDRYFGDSWSASNFVPDGSPNIASWLSRLAPRIRLPKLWRDYISTPAKLCYVGEDQAQLNDLFQRHAVLRATDSRGTPLPGSLESTVRDWLQSERDQALVLLGDFGDGKSAFTYIFARKLAHELRDRGAGGWLPLRISLRSFRQFQTARELLVQRLAEIGVNLSDWRSICAESRALVILDGFDEMSARLDPAAIANNVSRLVDCRSEFAGAKILITSRTSFLDPLRDSHQALERIGSPPVVRIAPLRRVDATEHLKGIASELGVISKYRAISRMYDPIGLATKPLFLEMIRATMEEIPTDGIDAISLYEIYIEKSLRRKIEDLGEAELGMLSGEVIDNLIGLLEEIAAQLQKSDAGYVSLAELAKPSGSSLCAALWRMADSPLSSRAGPNDERTIADAAARVGVRSLLVPVIGPPAASWPVTFFHRSVQEFLLARQLTRLLVTNSLRARERLSEVLIGSEICSFMVSIIDRGSTSEYVPVLLSFAKSAVRGLAPSFIGGNAVSLLHGLQAFRPNSDWSDLNLDYARLDGADLTGMRLCRSSLRSADLDNADLTNADLRGADLSNVRLEETASVRAISVEPDSERVLAAYANGEIREWELAPSQACKSILLARSGERAIEAVARGPSGSTVLFADGHCTVLSPDEPEPELVRYRTKDHFRLPRVIGSRVSYATEILGVGTRLTVCDLNQDALDTALVVGHHVAAFAHLQGLGFVFVDMGGDGLHIAPSTVGDAAPSLLKVDGASFMSLAALHEASDRWLIGTGERDGMVSVWSVASKPLGDQLGNVELSWTLIMRKVVHDGPVNTLAFSSREAIVSGGSDRVVAMTGLQQTEASRPDLRLHLTLRCRGVLIDGLEGPTERARLTELSATM